MLIAQISDCHIVEPGGVIADRADPAEGLRRAVDLINALDPQPDLVIVSGDLVNDGTPAQYDHLVVLLAEIRVPVVPLPGNHDDRSELRRRFAVLPDGGPLDPIDFVVDEHEVRLICLDTTIPGSHAGQLTPEQLAWLEPAVGGTTRPTDDRRPASPAVPLRNRMDGPRLRVHWRRARGRRCSRVTRHVEAVVCGAHPSTDPPSIRWHRRQHLSEHRRPAGLHGARRATALHRRAGGDRPPRLLWRRAQLAPGSDRGR